MIVLNKVAKCVSDSREALGGLILASPSHNADLLSAQLYRVSLTVKVLTHYYCIASSITALVLSVLLCFFDF